MCCSLVSAHATLDASEVTPLHRQHLFTLCSNDNDGMQGIDRAVAPSLSYVDAAPGCPFRQDATFSQTRRPHLLCTVYCTARSQFVGSCTLDPVRQPASGSGTHFPPVDPRITNNFSMSFYGSQQLQVKYELLLRAILHSLYAKPAHA